MPESKASPGKAFWRKVERRLLFRWRGIELLAPLLKAARVVPNKIACISFDGLYHADNPACIADKMLEMRPDLDVVWLVGDRWRPDPGPDGRIRIVRLFSWQALRELATARVWMDNMRMLYFIPKKKNQFYVQTWHGSIPLKMIENDAVGTLSPEYVERARQDGACSDLMLSGCRFFTELCRRSFFFGGEVLECGTPRLDVLFHPDPEKADAVRARYGLTPEDAVVLYAPTFRQNLDRQVYLTDFSRVLEAFARTTGKRTKILLRMHPNVQALFRGRTWGENVVEAMDIPDIQDLYAAADFLVTDYSSSMFEFALLGKPVFLHMPDYGDYVRERKLYFQPEELPFPVAFSTRELVAAVERTGTDASMWKEKAEAFFRRIGLCETGNATRLAAERILREIPPPSV